MFRTKSLGLAMAIVAFATVGNQAQAEWVNGWWVYPYSYFYSRQLNARPLTYDMTKGGVTFHDIQIADPPINANGIFVQATNFSDKPAWTFRWIAIWHTEISGLWRTPGYHHDFIHVIGGGNNQALPTSVLIQDVDLHDGDAIPINIQDGWFDKITLRDVRIRNAGTGVQIAAINTGYVDTITIDHCPGLKVSLMGRPGSIKTCYVKNSPGIRIWDTVTTRGQSGVRIIYLD